MQSNMFLDTGASWLNEVFTSAVHDESNTLADQEVVRLMQKLNNNVTAARILNKLKVMLTQGMIALLY